MRIRVYKLSEDEIGVRYDDELQVAEMFFSWTRDPDFINLVSDLREIYNYDEMSEEQLSSLIVIMDQEVK